MAPAKLISWALAFITFLIALRVLQALVGPLIATWRLGPKGQEHPTDSIPGWGEAFDPIGDCAIKQAGPLLTIDVPGTLHDLSVEQGQVGAPRVLRVIERDFVAEVTVDGQIQPRGDGTSTYAVPYHGAGLLIWLDRDSYIRLERAAILSDENLFHYVNFESRHSARMESSSATGTTNGPLALRLERRGARVTASYRAPGDDWVKIPKWVGVRWWGRSLRVGVVAVNTATDPLTAEFRDLQFIKSSNESNAPARDRCTRNLADVGVCASLIMRG